jgi:predicted transcriptional regulator
MKAITGTRNDGIGRKPNKEKSFTKSRSFAQSQELKRTIKKRFLAYLEDHKEPISYRELGEKMNTLQTNLHSSMKDLQKTGIVSYKMGRHRFSKRLVQKHYLVTDENRIQLSLFNNEA